MATAAQILANTRNAARSTGPRTVKGKSIVRGNALEHGRDALTLVPGLEHEHAKEVKQRVARYLDDWQPRTDAELDLVCQAARLSLAIELRRADGDRPHGGTSRKGVRKQKAFVLANLSSIDS